MSADPADTATIATRVEARRPAVTAAPQRSSGAARITNPREAIRVDEARRIYILAVSGALAALFTVASLVPMLGHPTAKLVHGISLIAAAVVAGVVALRLRDPDRYTTGSVTVMAAFLGVALSTSFVFWGVFSSAVLFLPIALYFFSSASSYWPSMATLLFAGVPHLVIGVASSLGWIADVGVVQPAVLRIYEKLAVIGIAQFGFAATFLLGRMTRRSFTDVVEKLDGAARAVAKREALLAEAKQDLERALQVGGPGLYTEQTLGSYRLGNLIGRGAMGEVYEGIHVDTEQRAAVKVLTLSAGAQTELVQRFLREVEIASKLQSPHVVRVLGVPGGDGGLPFLAMEMLQGASLAELLRHTPRFEAARAVDMIEQLARGVDAAHAAGIIHRDLKPSNVFRHDTGGAPLWKILDFGVSKLSSGGGTITQGALIGTPSYMAPEQARGQAVDHRADIYALGLIAYRTLTGRPAFTGADIPALLYAAAHEVPPRPSSVADLPPEIDAALAIAIAKDPALRFDTAGALAAALAAAARGALPADVTRRARDAVARYPWGSSS